MEANLSDAAHESTESQRSELCTSNWLAKARVFLCVNASLNVLYSVNRVVEVLVSGFRMKYPFCYVFTTDIDEHKTQKCLLNKSSNHKTVATISEMLSNDSFCQSKPILCPYQQQIPTHTYLLKNCVTQELQIPQQKAIESLKVSEETSDNLALWSVFDPCIKYNCNCFRCKTKKNASKQGSSHPNHASANKKGDKADKESKNKVTKSVPFHKRSPLLTASDPLTTSSITISTTSSSGTNAANQIVSNSSQPTSVPTYSYKSPISHGGLPSLQSSVATPSGANGLDSPHSVAQSLILDGPTSSVEQSNLSVSPHPIKEEHNNESHTDAADPKDKTRLEQLLSPNVKPNVSANNSPAVHPNQWSQQLSDLDSISVQNPVSDTSNATVNNTSSESANHLHNNIANGVKRPALAISTYEDNETDMRNGLLYDYSHLNDLSDICDIPAPKNRRKNAFNEFKRISVDYYSGKKKTVGALLNGEFADAQYMSKPKDPYEFSEFDEDGLGYKVVQNGVSDESVSDPMVRLECVLSPDSANNNSQTNKDNPKTNSAEMSATPPQLSKGFTNVSELVPSLKDLDQIFDTSSGEDSNDETFPPPSTPSGTSNRSTNATNACGTATVVEESKSNKNSSSTNIHASMAELARMFPTPPSLEPMAPSPCGNFLGADPSIIDDLQSLYPCSPNIIQDSKVCRLIISN